MNPKTTIQCKNCKSDINVSEALYNQLEAQFQIDTQTKRDEYKKALQSLNEKEEAIKEQQQMFEQKLHEQLKVEKQKLNEELKLRFEAQQRDSLEMLNKELEEKSIQLQEFNKTKTQLQILQREGLEAKEKIQAEAETLYSQKLKEEKSKQEAIQDKAAKEYEKHLHEALERMRIQTQTATEQKLSQESNQQIALLKQELDEKSNKVKELHASQIEIQRLKREAEEMVSQAKADTEIAVMQNLKEEKERYLKEADEKLQLRLKEKDEQLEQIKRQLDETKRKAEQGSMQVQGEAQEHLIESWLTSQFVFDTIEEIGKGAFGADCIQTVNTRDLQNCGKICFESKNAKTWSNDWIPKFKQDMLKANADIGVLVTQTMPKNIDRMGFVDGVWVCNLGEFKGSASLLREGLIKVRQATRHQENKTDKMHILYDFLTGNEFNMQLRSIVNGFMQMQEELDKEKRSLMASWKRQQKNIDMVLANTTAMYGSIKAIAGNAIENVKALEFEYEDTDEKGDEI